MSAADWALPGNNSLYKRTDDHDGYARQQARKAARLWDHRQPLTGSIAETDLREARSS
jgi:hypothetical protein